MDKEDKELLAIAACVKMDGDVTMEHLDKLTRDKFDIRIRYTAWAANASSVDFRYKDGYLRTNLTAQEKTNQLILLIKSHIMTRHKKLKWTEVN